MLPMIWNDTRYSIRALLRDCAARGALARRLAIAIALFASAFALNAVAQQGTSPLEDAELRAAAVRRVSWRDPRIDASRGSIIEAKILGFNDFHGALITESVAGRPAGGAAVLAAYLTAAIDRVGGLAVIVHAGDMVGVSPPLSALQLDEPTIRFLNLLGNAQCRVGSHSPELCNVVGTLGNHEFDRGRAELLRLLQGGSRLDAGGKRIDWEGTGVSYVSANVIDDATRQPLIEPYVVKDLGGVRVAFIGAVLKLAPLLVPPEGIAGLTFEDEAQAINRYVAVAEAEGIKSIVVTIHQGLRQRNFGSPVALGATEIIDIVKALDDEVDIVVSGHAHGYTNLLVANENGKEVLVTQAFSHGTAYADIDVSLDRVSGDVVAKSASIITSWADEGTGLTPDPAVALLVDAAGAEVQPLLSRKVGAAVTSIGRTANASGEVPQGTFFADAFRAAAGVDLAFARPGRTDISAGDVLWGDVFEALPFGNQLVVLSLTGAQVRRLLNQQWASRTNAALLQVAGLTYTWDARRAADDRVVEVLGPTGAPLAENVAYSVVVTEFLAGGGAGFSVLAEGTDRRVEGFELEAVIDYIAGQDQPIRAPLEGRVRKVE